MRPHTPEGHIRDTSTTPRARANTCVPRRPPPRGTPAHPRNLYPKALSQLQTNGSDHTTITSNGCPETAKICFPPPDDIWRRWHASIQRNATARKGILRARPPPAYGAACTSPGRPPCLARRISLRACWFNLAPPWFPLPGPRARLTDLKPQALTFRSLGQKYYQPAQTYKQHVPLIPAAYCAQAPQVKEKNAACYQPSWATDSDKPRSRYVTSLIKHQSA